MSHFENLRSILHSGALLSQKELEGNKIRWNSIANKEVQDLRRRIHVWDLFEKQYRPLHSYVPFYFTTDTPMLRNQRERGIQNNIVIFEVSRAYIGSIDQRILFTDGNASNQQLSKSAGEVVYIVPATTSNGSCRREYLPDGRPYGTNTKCSDFYADVAYIDRVSWDVIDGHLFVDDKEEYKRLKHAEVLTCPVPDIMDKCIREKALPRKVSERDGNQEAATVYSRI